MRLLTATIALLPLAACSNAQSQPTPAAPSSGVCSNDALGQFNGQPASRELGHRIMLASGARTVRWVPKGSVVTMEFNAERVTVLLDASNLIETARCG